MKFVYILTALVGLGFGTWIGILAVNGLRKRFGRKKDQ